MTKLMGADNGAYRGGVTELRCLVRNSKTYHDWKSLVYQRDRYKCQKCGFVGDRRTLECHHVNKEFAELLQDFLKAYPQYSLPKDKLRLTILASVYVPMWKITNGQTLCKNCHRTLHREMKLKEHNDKPSSI
jgi:5-methylcytosine-specific restriction endonuclease McrA